MAKDILENWMMFWESDERLKRLTRQVWRRIPACDRAVLRELLQEVSDSYPQDTNILGTAQPVDPDLMQDGCAANIVKEVYHIVELGRVREIPDDDAACHVIAHEFAHVVLRHTEMRVVAANLLMFELYTDSDLDTLRDWHEDHADLQAWLWGFEREMHAFFVACPEARRPRWYVNLSTQPEAARTDVGGDEAEIQGMA
jgi:hypothetical protein